MTDQEMNEKLAEFSGFRLLEYFDMQGIGRGRHWELPDKANGLLKFYSLPDFRSLDALLEYAVPKLNAMSIYPELFQEKYTKDHLWHCDMGQYPIIGNEDAGIAFRDAILKILEEEEKWKAND